MVSTGLRGGRIWILLGSIGVVVLISKDVCGAMARRLSCSPVVMTNGVPPEIRLCWSALLANGSEPTVGTGRELEFQTVVS